MTLPRDNKRTRLQTSLTLDVLGNDLLVRCASYLNADGLAQLGRTSARFGIPQAGQQRSLVNEAARQRFRESATDEERGRLPKYDDESDIGLFRALELLRRPLCFDELAGNVFSPQENPASVTYTGDKWSTAVSGHVMRGGRHFVEIAIENHQQGAICLGVVRPVLLADGIDLEAAWEGNVNPAFVSSRWKPAPAEKLRSQRTAKWRDSSVHSCAYLCSSGFCYWTDWDNDGVSDHSSDWQGRGGLGGSSTIGMLLDLDEGTLTVFKDGRRLGVMKERLGGEYCWFVAARFSCTISISRGLTDDFVDWNGLHTNRMCKIHKLMVELFRNGGDNVPHPNMEFSGPFLLGVIGLTSFATTVLLLRPRRVAFAQGPSSPTRPVGGTDRSSRHQTALGHPNSPLPPRARRRGLIALSLPPARRIASIDPYKGGLMSFRFGYPGRSEGRVVARGAPAALLQPGLIFAVSAPVPPAPGDRAAGPSKTRSSYPVITRCPIATRR
ncbi:hypothetical protein THAOC_08333 [Thalassiosira oceanica]|uniref:B30.2/SPRY domain-containing protein n=1 Tax=Thalassiosira oceanica TaxID=159749 RepID=K0SV99_THAOC|nr:hypothetical protein THAOC_08333 [Thalassiosira oceanica]|eukprot:EJK70318.1 hypothetical protein THAOC_08333 [Thalassiosira oceanica]